MLFGRFSDSLVYKYPEKMHFKSCRKSLWRYFRFFGRFLILNPIIAWFYLIFILIFCKIIYINQRCECVMSSSIQNSGEVVLNRFAYNLNKTFKGDRNSLAEIVVLLSRHCYHPSRRDLAVVSKIRSTFQNIINDSDFQNRDSERWKKDLNTLLKLEKFVEENKSDLDALSELAKDAKEYHRVVEKVYSSRGYSIQIPEALLDKRKEKSDHSIQ